MRKIIFLLIIGWSCAAWGQGMAVSYLIPVNGEFASPVSPLSVRGLGLNLGKVLKIETGFSVYNFPGLPVDGLPVNTTKPLRGHHFGLLVPIALAPTFDLGGITLSVSGGGFIILHSNSRLNHANLNNALATLEGWDIADNQLKLQNKMTTGWLAGIDLEYPLSRTMALTFGINYLSGKAETPVTGSYAGGDIGGIIEERQASFTQAHTRLQGVEMMFGVNLKK